MEIQELLKFAVNNGLAIFLVVWGVWRLDKFLSALSSHFSNFDKELKILTSMLHMFIQTQEKKSEIKP